MDALGGAGGLPWNFLPGGRRRRKSRKPPKSLRGGGWGSKVSFNFPVKQAATAAYFCLAGDTIAQVGSRCSALERKAVPPFKWYIRERVQNTGSLPAQGGPTEAE
ncbi:hypothetical protein Syun_027978 [Stephania yunnanensis]|uniref:Uncharacterized protein n=1 Tax=Stephania yunnanensis TaxID=152371 RepID=A0AAP0EJW0_9MAGN